MTFYTRTWKDKYLVKGKKFIISRRPTSVSDDDSSELVIQNTSDSEYIFIDSIKYKNNNGKAYVDATKNIDIDSSGSDADLEDMRVDADESDTIINAEYGGSYSGGSTFALDMITGASGSPTKGRTSTGVESSAFLIAPGEAMRFTITNKSGGTSDQLIVVIAYQDGV